VADDLVQHIDSNTDLQDLRLAGVKGGPLHMAVAQLKALTKLWRLGLGCHCHPRLAVFQRLSSCHDGTPAESGVIVAALLNCCCTAGMAANAAGAEQPRAVEVCVQDVAPSWHSLQQTTRQPQPTMP
jgi:hypothetical protein